MPDAAEVVVAPAEMAEAPVPADRPLRRRGRTAALIAGAAALGLVAGTCAGFLVQADREPTKLPPLSQPVLAQAKGKGPEPLSAEQDRKVRTDGDLRKLLLKKPKGATESGTVTGGDGWVDMAGYAGFFKKPDGAFTSLVEEEFRRAAVTGWRVGSTFQVEIRLVQYHQEEFLGASGNAENGYYWAGDEDDTDSWPIPGTGDGMAFVHNQPEIESGYLPYYTAEAHAWRGDIALEIWLTDTKPIPKSKILDVAERQMERL
ncbi:MULTISPECIES: hypothetical protein [unclassified Streptomyces]|uniref:hypothetical protein n=1 Tax=unclassified Streptomyces TaxID=2593676 RepID=UPI002DDA4D11|nr:MULTISPECIES: hypothetical protein [unclassified Streptomyces]